MIPTRIDPILKKNTQRLIALTFSVYGLFLRYAAYSQRSLTPDELNQLNYTSTPQILPFWNKYTGAELTAFPGEYLLTYPFVRMFGPDKWGIAIPHIVATAIGFYVLYRICNRYIRTLSAYWIPFAFVCFNQHLIYHAFEFRPYAVLPTLALACFYCSETLIDQYETLNRPKKFLIGLLYIATIIYHAYGALIVFVCVLYFLLSKRETESFSSLFKKFFPFLSSIALIGGSLFIWYATRHGNFSMRQVHGGEVRTFDYFPNPLSDLNNFIRTVFSRLAGFKKIKPLVNGILIALLIPNKDKFKQTGFFLLLIILPIQLKFVGDLFKQYWFLERQFIWVMPFYALLLGWCWDSIFLFLVGTSFIKKILRARDKSTSGHE